MLYHPKFRLEPKIFHFQTATFPLSYTAKSVAMLWCEKYGICTIRACVLYLAGKLGKGEGNRLEQSVWCVLYVTLYIAPMNMAHIWSHWRGSLSATWMECGSHPEHFDLHVDRAEGHQRQRDDEQVEHVPAPPPHAPAVLIDPAS